MRNCCPPAVETLRQYGLTTAYINAFVEQNDDIYIYDTIELPNGQWSYQAILSALVHLKYKPIQIGCFMFNLFSEELSKEEVEQQQHFKEYLKQCKTEAKKIYLYGKNNLKLEDYIE